MANFFFDNPDLQFQFNRINLSEQVGILEHGYTLAEKFEDAPRDYEEAVDYYRSALELLGEICGDRIAPRAMSVDEHGTKFVDGKVEYAPGTVENVKDLGEAGFMGVIIPRQFGGISCPATLYMFMIEMLSRADGSLMTLFGYQDVGEAIAKYGTEEQGHDFLHKYCRGEEIGAMVLTEPGAGSDLQAIKVKAFQDDDGNWYLNGVKQFISNGNGGVLLVLARSEPGTNDLFGLSLFAVHGGDRVEINSVEHKMGLHGSPTCQLFFNDAPAHLIGNRRFGLIYVLNILNHARFSVAAQALGIAEGAYREALEYAKIREAFGQIIYDIPPVANMLIDMSTTLEVMRSMIYAGSHWLDLRNTLEEHIEELKAAGKPFKEEKIRFDRASRFLNLLSPMTKYIATEAAVKICYDAQQLHGGMGYMREMPVERMVRDVRITTIYEGTTQVQVSSCAKRVLSDDLKELMDEMDARSYHEDVSDLHEMLRENRNDFYRGVEMLTASDSDAFKGAAMKNVVDMYGDLWAGYLVLGETLENERKKIIARRFIKQARANAIAGIERINNAIYSDLSSRDTICEGLQPVTT
ncbi:MAG: acyl-CoA dehydrogenase [Rhodothermales bacterium]|nr:acyl-CoA dehydrogenase [Rhodothermales bacterium]